MVLPDDTTARQAKIMADSSLDNVFLSPGIRLSDLDKRRAAAASASTQSQLSGSRRVGELADKADNEDVEMKDALVDDGSDKTITPQAASSSVDAATTAESKRSSVGDSGDSTISATSRASSSSSSDDADGSITTPIAEPKEPVVASGPTASTSTAQRSQEISEVPVLALDGPSEQRGSTSGANTSTNTNNNNNNIKNSSIHDLSAASYLARHRSKTAQTPIIIPDSTHQQQQQPLAAAAASSSKSPSTPTSTNLPTPSIILSPPPKKRQILTYENRALQNQTIENTFQALWTRRQNFLRAFAKTYNMTLGDEADDGEERTPAEDVDNDDDKRKDSFATPRTTTQTPTASTLATTPTSTLSQQRAAARHRALEMLLEAWYEKLGPRRPNDSSWTRYSEKTTPAAVLALRSILIAGDPTLHIPITALPAARQTYWQHKLRSTKFWFTSVDQAIDFLSAFGIDTGDSGSPKFGSGITRIDVLQYSLLDTNGKCLSAEHYASERTWKAGVEQWAPNEFPPVRYCPCTEYKLLMKIIGAAQKLPEPGSERAIRWMSNRLTRDWQRANLAAGVDVAKDWPSEVGEGNLPLMLSLGGVDGFAVWHCLGRDEERGVSLRTIRLEGRFAELL